MTTRASNLAVIHLPSTYEAEWRKAVADSALRGGWGVLDQAFADPQQAPAGQSLLINCHDPSTVMEWKPDEIVILKPRIDDSIAAATQLIGDWAEAVRFVSLRLAQSCALLTLDLTSVVDASQPGQAIGSLGLVDAGFKPAPARLTAGPLAIYDDLPPSLRKPGVAWPQSLFIVNTQDHGDQVENLRMDLTGRRRLLQGGPAITLTAGIWEARAKVAVGVRSSPIDLRFEWGTGHDVAVLVHTVRASGIYEVVLEKAWHSPQPAELRIWLDRAMFDGGFEFLSCEVCLLANATASLAS